MFSIFCLKKIFVLGLAVCVYYQTFFWESSTLKSL